LLIHSIREKSAHSTRPRLQPDNNPIDHKRSLRGLYSTIDQLDLYSTGTWVAGGRASKKPSKCYGGI